MKIPITWLKDYVKTDASPREIASSFTQLGLMLDKPLDDSGVLDLEHRMDRSDWLSILGCARDYSAFSKLKLVYPKTNTKRLAKVKPSEIVEISVKTPHVRRFNTRLVKNVTVGPSPSWLKERLEAYGIRSINNVVDITNFVMIEYGQPMHAQDLAKLKKREITLRPAKRGESLKTILGTEVALDPNTFVLSSGGVPTVIGGIVGGSETGVTNSTTELILDAGNYDQAVVRKTSRRLKIINETVSRYDKFLHPDLCELALERATYLLDTIAGATVYTNVDYYPQPPKAATMTLTFARLKVISGLDHSAKLVKRILTALEYHILKETETSLTLTVPTFRTDVEVEDDIVADILRINDYSNIPTSPLTTPVPVDITPAIMQFEEHLRDLLVAQGAHEHITTSLVLKTQPTQITLSNALSADQNALRESLLPKLTEVAQNYHKHGLDLPLFEIGVVFKLNEKGDYLEQRQLTVLSNSLTVSTLLHQLGISPRIISLDYQSLNILLNEEVVGHLDGQGSYSLDTTLLHKYYHPYTGVISELSYLPTRDISLDHSLTHNLATLIRNIYQLDPELSEITSKSVELRRSKSPTSTLNTVLTLRWNRGVSDSHLKATLQKIKAYCLKEKYVWKSD